MGQQSKKDYAQQARERRAQIEKEKREKERRQNRIIWGIVGGILAVILIVVGIVLLTRPKKTVEEVIEKYLDSSYVTSEEQTDLVHLTVTYTNKENQKIRGHIYVQLAPDVAPITVANFKSLVGSGFYNGLTFHRVYPGFMIQGGDPKGDGTGGSGTNIKGEFSANGVENNLSHNRGVISMARGSYSYDSASSQFFIVQDDSAISSLDGLYASFGYVVSGIETVDEITEIQLAQGGDTVPTSPVYPVTIESAVFVKEN